jgi:cytochrome bd-type quinol oxidase subunit 1
MDYPLWLGSTLAGGVVIGVVAIVHVIIAHFAIGAGFVIIAAETTGHRRGDPAFVEFARRHSYLLLLLSVVLGTLTGVGIWFTIGLVSPVGTSMLIHTYVWGWAIEWVFFIIEIAAALIYYDTWNRISDRLHMKVGWLYFFAAWFSMVIINGIISFMLTPGHWLETGAFWDGFLNPSYFPSLFFRTALSVLLGAVFGMVVVSRMKRHDAGSRARLTRWLGMMGIAATVVLFVSLRWWVAVIPEDAASLFSSPGALYHGTWRLIEWSAVITGILLVVLVIMPKANWLPVAGALVVAAATYFGGWERIREASRKPYLIYEYMFSNGIRVAEVETLNREGILSRAPWALVRPDGEQPSVGEAVYRAQCKSCHTIDGYNAIRPLVEGFDHWTLDGIFSVLDQNPAMPPFVGTEEERMQLARYLAEVGGMPPEDPLENGGRR